MKIGAIVKTITIGVIAGITMFLLEKTIGRYMEPKQDNFFERTKSEVSEEVTDKVVENDNDESVEEANDNNDLQELESPKKCIKGRLLLKKSKSEGELEEAESQNQSPVSLSSLHPLKRSESDSLLDEVSPIIIGERARK